MRVSAVMVQTEFARTVSHPRPDRVRRLQIDNFFRWLDAVRAVAAGTTGNAEYGDDDGFAAHARDYPTYGTGLGRLRAPVTADRAPGFSLPSPASAPRRVQPPAYCTHEHMRIMVIMLNMINIRKATK